MPHWKVWSVLHQRWSTDTRQRHPLVRLQLTSRSRYHADQCEVGRRLAEVPLVWINYRSLVSQHYWRSLIPWKDRRIERQKLPLKMYRSAQRAHGHRQIARFNDHWWRQVTLAEIKADWSSANVLAQTNHPGRGQFYKTQNPESKSDNSQPPERGSRVVAGARPLITDELM